LRRRVRDAERRMAALAEEKATLERRLADPAAYEGEAAPTQEWLRRQGELGRLLAAAEEEWLTAEEALAHAAT
jgi:ATP-binding cassette subfamily F protein 3